jgi:hypothetical protein
VPCDSGHYLCHGSCQHCMLFFILILFCFWERPEVKSRLHRRKPLHLYKFSLEVSFGIGRVFSNYKTVVTAFFTKTSEIKIHNIKLPYNIFIVITFSLIQTWHRIPKFIDKPLLYWDQHSVLQSSQHSIPGLLKPPNNKFTINNLSQLTPTLGRRVSLVAVSNTGGRRDTSPR